MPKGGSSGSGKQARLAIEDKVGVSDAVEELVSETLSEAVSLPKTTAKQPSKNQSSKHEVEVVGSLSGGWCDAVSSYLP